MDEAGAVFELLAAVRRGSAAPPVLVLVAESEPDPAALQEAAAKSGIEPAVLAGDRVRILVAPEPADLAVVLAGALAYVAPATRAWDPTGLIEAFSLGVPVIHSDVPAYRETAAGAGLSVEVQGGGDGYRERLADAVRAVLDDDVLADRLGVSGGDRAHAFSWSATAAQIWQLHADL
nr:glycosyltransferase [Agromyces seonyuensis]